MGTATATSVTKTTMTVTTMKITTMGITAVTATACNPIVTHIPGPRLGNDTFENHCSEPLPTLEDADLNCIEYSNCTVLHGHNCDSQGWRYCSGDIREVWASSVNTSACTLVAHSACKTDTTTATATSVT